MKHNYWITLLVIVTILLVGCGGSTPEGENNTANTDNITAVPVTYVFDQVLYENGFENPLDPSYVTDVAKLGNHSFLLTSERKFSPSYQMSAKAMGLKSGDRIKVKAFMYRAPEHEDISTIGSVVVGQNRNGETLQWKGLAIEQYIVSTNQTIVGKWAEISHTVTFEEVQENDTINIYIWNPKGQPLYIDNWQIERWRDQSAIPDINSIPNGYVFSSLLYENGFEDPNDINTITAPVATGKRAYRLIPQVEYAPGLNTTLGEIGAQPGDYIRASVKCLRQEGFINAKGVASLVVSINGKADNISIWQSCPIERYLRDEQGRTVNIWKELPEWVLVPEGAKPEHKLSAYVWKPRENGQGSIILDDFKLELWKKGDPQ